MYVLLLDEFGHAEAFDPRQCPVFGYGGILIPGHQLSAFCTQFFDLKIVAFRNVYKSRVATRLGGQEVDTATGKFLPRKSNEFLTKILGKMNSLKNDELIRDPEIRRLAAQYEVKGAEVFSSGYVSKLNDKIAKGKTSARRKKGRFFRFSRLFLDIIAQNDGTIFYYGFHRAKYPSLNPKDRIHVELVKDVVEQANRFAKNNNTTVKIIFDHHHTDEVRHLRDKQGQFLRSKHGHKLQEKTREDRAAEVIINGGFYDNITDPIFRAKSHLSQGIQAADWVCTLLKYLWVYRTEQSFGDFYEALDRQVFENVCEVAKFKSKSADFTGRIYPEQTKFDFPDPSSERFNRPYFAR